jgi:deoxyribonuclease V
LSEKPDLLLVGGQGLAQPRRFGLACHLGVLGDVPRIGVAKSRLVGTYQQPGIKPGCSEYIHCHIAVLNSCSFCFSNQKSE